jgi:hypothetical protein
MSLSRILLEKLAVAQVANKFPAFLWNPKVCYSDIIQPLTPYPEPV